MLRKIMIGCICTLFSGVYAQTGFITPEELGEKTFNAIKEQDTEAFSNLAINPTDKIYILDKVKPEEKKEADKALTSYILKWKKEGNTLLHTLYKTGVSKGITWEDATFEKVEYEVLHQEKLEKSDIYLLFICKNIRYRIKLDDCMPVQRGWVLIDDIRFK